MYQITALSKEKNALKTNNFGDNPVYGTMSLKNIFLNEWCNLSLDRTLLFYTIIQKYPPRRKRKLHQMLTRRFIQNSSRSFIERVTFCFTPLENTLFRYLISQFSNVYFVTTTTPSHFHHDADFTKGEAVFAVEIARACFCQRPRRSREDSAGW